MIKCSQSCGGGIQTRKAQCVDLDGRSIPEVHCPAEEKLIRQSCHVESCPRWEVGDWTPVGFPFFSISIVIKILKNPTHRPTKKKS